MNNVVWLFAEKRDGVARFLLATLPIMRADAQAMGLEATAQALEAAVCAIGMEAPTALREVPNFGSS